MKKIILSLLVINIVCFISQSAFAETYKAKIAASPYVTWYLLEIAENDGTLAKYAKKNNVSIEIDFKGDYVSTINLVSSGGYDGVVITTMDALTGLAGAGLDVTFINAYDYSNGNDAVITLLPDVNDFSNLPKGTQIALEQGSVSDYLLEKALQKNNLKYSDFEVVNLPFSDIMSAFGGKSGPSTVVTWNPAVVTFLSDIKGTKSLYDSSLIKEQIIDGIAIKTDVLKKHPGVGYALTQTMNEMLIRFTDSSKKEKLFEEMAAMEGEHFPPSLMKAQLKTTRVLSANESVDLLKSETLKKTMKNIYDFVVKRGILDTNQGDATIIFSDNSTAGSKNVGGKLRFSSTYYEK